MKDSKSGNPDRISKSVQLRAQTSDQVVAFRSSISSGEQYDTGVPTPLDGGDDFRNASPKSMSKTFSDIYFGATEENVVGWTIYFGAEGLGFPPENVKTSSLIGLPRWRLTSLRDHSLILDSCRRTFFGVISKKVVNQDTQVVAQGWSLPPWTIPRECKKETVFANCPASLRAREARRRRLPIVWPGQSISCDMLGPPTGVT